MCAARGRGTRCRERQQRKGVPLRGTGQGGNAFGAPALSPQPPHPHLHTAPSHLLQCSAGMVTLFSGLVINAGCFQKQLQNQGQGQATFGSPSVPAGSSALLRPSPAGGLQSPAEPLRVSGFARPRWRRSTAPLAATVPVAPRPPPRRCRCFKVDTPFRRVGCVHSVSALMPVSLAVLRGGLFVAPPGRHPGVKCTPPKLFANGRKNFCLRPLLPSLAGAPLPLPR